MLGANRVRLAMLLVTATMAVSGVGSPCLASDAFTFDLIPGSGDLFGPAGSTVGWGYSITNQSDTDWLLTTNLVSDSFLYGTAGLLFDFPEIAPGQTVTEAFDPINQVGLYQLTWNPDASVNFVNNGNFVLSAQWYDRDPLNGGNYLADAIDSNASYTATVSVSGAPEPASFALMAAGLTAICLFGAWLRMTETEPGRTGGRSYQG